jgi:hypothetical protein
MQPSVTAIRSHTKPSIRFLSNIIHFFLVTLSKKFRTILKCNNLHVNNLKALLARIDQFPVECQLFCIFQQTYLPTILTQFIH